MIHGNQLRVSVLLKPKQRQMLDELSKQTGFSASQITRMAIDHVNKHPTIAAELRSNERRKGNGVSIGYCATPDQPVFDD